MATNQTRGVRNCNPGNIRRGIKWLGLAEQQNDKAFSQFKSMEYGLRAMWMLLNSYYSRTGLRNVHTIISRWAPPSDGNATNLYIESVSDAALIAPNDEIPQAPSNFAYFAYWAQIIRQMCVIESNFRPSRIELLKSWCMAFASDKLPNQV